MANNLTGEFDVVAEFSLPAANRMLAAMHRVERFPHSLSLRVDDVPDPGPRGPRPSVLEIVDAFGEALANPVRIRTPTAPPSASPNTAAAFGRLGGIVNMDLAGIYVAPVEPSRLQGRAQLQMAPPTLEIADAAATRIRVRLPLRARYFPDPNTPPAASFARGELVITTAVNQIASQSGNVVDIDLRGNAVQATFTPAWSSQPLSAENVAGINLLIKNALSTSFLPSNTTLPADIASMKFKALGGPSPALAVMVNRTNAGGNANTVQRVFLDGDDFAFAIGADAVRAELASTLEGLVTSEIPRLSVLGGTYRVDIRQATVHFEVGHILLKIEGRAVSPNWYLPNFNFVLGQQLGLQPRGATADVFFGPASFSTDDTLVNIVRNRVRDRILSARDQAWASSGAQAKVRAALDSSRVLGGFFRSLLTPARGGAPLANGATLAYTAADISPDGVVLRGSLSVLDWPVPHVEFQEIPSSVTGPLAGTVPSGPEYSALKSWIPGGTIQSFEWKPFGETSPGAQDVNTFVRLPPEPELSASDGVVAAGRAAFSPMCLTIRGTRPSASGQVQSQTVTASYCAFEWFPVLDGLRLSIDSVAPMAALTRPGAGGFTEIVGHAPAAAVGVGSAMSNRLVHFGDAESGRQLPDLLAALEKCNRPDAATVVVAIVPLGHAAKMPFVPGIVYAESSDGSWERSFGVTLTRRPTTAVIGPKGAVLWTHEGPIDVGALAAVLARVLQPAGRMRSTIAGPAVRIGQKPPNFLFEHAPGQGLTLHKLTGRPVVLVFCNRASATSLEAVATEVTRAPRGATVLAIVHADAKGSEHRDINLGSGATAVRDTGGVIAQAYGVSAWPTVVSIDATGVVRSVRFATPNNIDAPDVADVVQQAGS